MRRLAIACCFAAACSSGGASPGTAMAPDLGLRYVADTAAYRMVSHRDVSQEINGQPVRQAQHTRVWIRAILGGPGDTLAVRLVIDSIAETGGALAPSDLATARGAAWTARLAPTGELLAFTGPRTAGVLNQMANYLADFYPRLPGDGVRAGDTWVDTVTADVDVGGVVLTIASLHQSTAVGPDSHEGRPAFLIRVRTDYTMSGSGSQSGQPLTLDGTGRRHTREYLSPDGRYLGSIAADTSSFEVLLTSLGMTIPGTQIRADTLRLQ